MKLKSFFLLIQIFFLSNIFAQVDELNKAAGLVQKEKYKQARAILQVLDHKELQRSEYYRLYATCLFMEGDLKQGMSVLANGIELLPDSADLYDFRAYFFNIIGQYSAAERDYTMYLELVKEPKKRSLALANRGGMRQSTRDFEGAYQDLQEAIRLDSSNLAAWNNLATVCDELGKSEETESILKYILTVDSTYNAAFVNLGFSAQQKGNHEKAIAYFDQALDINPREALAYSNRSYSYYKLNNLKNALKDINKSLEYLPTNSYAYWVRAQIYIAQGKKKEACEDLNFALRLGYTKQYGSGVEDLVKEHCE